MRTEILVTLLFFAAASASIDGASDDGTGMCPITYLKKHPDAWKKKKELREKYGLPDFSKLKSCSSDETCDKGMKCCETPCGMKCMKAVFEENAMETIEQIHKEIATGVDDKPYEITEEDNKYGMCPNNYMKVHPELKEKFDHKCKHKHSHKCKDGEQCSHKHSHHKKHGHFRNFTALADCSVDGDCGNNMRCCFTICGKKCMKPVFTNEDLKESLFGKKEEKKNREKRDVGNDDESDSDQDDEMEHGKGHGKGKHGKGHKKGVAHRKGQCKGGDCNGECNGEEEEHGNRHGKGGKHGKGHGQGAKHGKGHGEGAKHGKGHGEGAKHGKGHGQGAKHGKGHDKGKHGKGHGKGLEHGKGHKKAQEHEDQDEE
ncbi:uncharacterized protein LOC142219153 [Leptodactylus fuscus]|uniref:uncharacterized protein LOC142219153 n=1 Tax=Leptodactylus fuscus TaxID=238119 RepID=UPI003F4E8DA1